MTFKEFYISDNDGKSNCVIRSLCKILNKEYEDVYNGLCDVSKELNCSSFNDIPVFEKYMEDNNIFKTDFDKDIMIKDLSLDDNSYIVFCWDKKDYYHMVSIINNIIYDKNSDCMDLYVISVYKYSDTKCNLFSYYKAYEKRYKQVYENGFLWSSKNPSPDVIETIVNNRITTDKKILELGCGEGRDAIFLLNKNYNVEAIDYSNTVIEKCRELSNYKYNNRFKQFDILVDKSNKKYDFIYSIAVIHMFVTEDHRNKFYKFIYEHLKQNGIALIVSMGDGEKIYESDINKAFDDVKRVVVNNNKEINIASTSCKIVNWKTFEHELLVNNFDIKKKWISHNIPEFNPVMYVIVSKNK